MPRLPSSQDVPTVRVASDPGLNVPTEAFESPLGIAAQELTPNAFEFSNMSKAKSIQFQEAEIRERNRRDTTDRASLILEENRQADLELRDLQSTKDLSDINVLQEYTELRNQRRADLLKAHQERGGSAESTSKLAVRLMDIQSTYEGRARALHVKRGRELALQVFDQGLSPIVAKVAQNPTPTGINQAFEDIETVIGDTADALDHTDESSRRSLAREQVALMAINSQIGRGNIESAAAMLQDPGVWDALPPGAQRDITRRIDTGRGETDRIHNELNQFRELLGRDPSEAEILDIAFDIKAQKPSRRDIEVQGLVDRGLSENLATDITDGNVRIVGPDQFGKFLRANKATGTSEPLTEADALAVTGIVEEQATEQQGEQPEQQAQPDQPEQQTQPEQQSLESAVAQGTGPVAGVQTAISNVIGPFITGALFKDTTDARMTMRFFTQMAKAAVVNNPKFPVAEQQLVAKFLPSPDTFFKDPDTARADLQNLRKGLNQIKASKGKELNSGKLTEARKGDLSDQISRVNEILTLMGPEEEEIQTLTEQTDVDSLSTGSKFIWGPDGEEYIKE